MAHDIQVRRVRAGYSLTLSFHESDRESRQVERSAHDSLSDIRGLLVRRWWRSLLALRDEIAAFDASTAEAMIDAAVAGRLDAVCGLLDLASEVTEIPTRRLIRVMRRNGMRPLPKATPIDDHPSAILTW